MKKEFEMISLFLLLLFTHSLNGASILNITNEAVTDTTPLINGETKIRELQVNAVESNEIKNTSSEREINEPPRDAIVDDDEIDIFNLTEVSEPLIVPEISWKLGVGDEGPNPPIDSQNTILENIRPSNNQDRDRIDGDTKVNSFEENEGYLKNDAQNKYITHLDNKIDLDIDGEFLKDIDIYRNKKNDFIDTSNPISLSITRWPIRDTNRLGVEPHNPICSLPMNEGTGPEQTSSWYFSKVYSRCEWFAYKGHGGNANRFSSRTVCESLCVYDKVDLCESVKCREADWICDLIGDPFCIQMANKTGKDVTFMCPPSQPVCKNRRNSYFAPDIDTSLIPRECFETVNSGSCLIESPFIQYFYDKTINSCSEFYFNGCGGNNNRFNKLASCMNHCVA